MNASSSAAGWRVPQDLSGKLSALEDEQRRFITSGDFLAFMPARQMEFELASRDADKVRALISDLKAVAAEMGYDESRDMGAIPLNLTAKRFNQGIMPPAALRKEDRSPGPFSVHRYIFPESGVPTFAGAPVAIWPEDLVAGKVDVAIVGIPNDMGSGRRNAGAAPHTMRSLNTISTPDIQTLVNPTEVLSVVDYGDLAIDSMSTERTIGHVTAMVAETAGTGAVPMMVGGDTSMLYPGVKGVAQARGKGSFGLVHFGAHPDADSQAVHTISDEQALFLLIDEGIVEGDELVTIGLRGAAVNQDTLQWLRDNKVRYHTMAAVNRNGYSAVLKRVLRELRSLPEQLFVSIDVSVIDPGDMVAAGRIAANGMAIQDLTRTVRHLCAARDIVGFEITDMAPMLDYSRLSAVNANAVLNACLVGMAARKAGYGPDDVHPLALDHGQ
ncbi:arginase family protein [Gilvimarinus sp. DZF01]|uniref:arginase family protein n=1 Tax=Gilvimarinus sp. DZF01 TaxID=3461371 RepID=UPI0040458AEE